ncbi:LSR protein, partial [Rhinopomastus cyanomelas]|nr:LSR protein [Rhinopomastus cyanomelas]
LQVAIADPRRVALLFQPVLLRCRFQTAAPEPPPVVTWKYKSFCPQTGSSGNLLGAGEADGSATAQVATGDCPDGARTIRIVATKQGATVTLGDYYRGRAVTIVGGAELSLGPVAWGDSGLYVCTVTSTQDLQGNNEAVAELVVLG